MKNCTDIFTDNKKLILPVWKELFSQNRITMKKGFSINRFIMLSISSMGEYFYSFTQNDHIGFDDKRMLLSFFQRVENQFDKFNITIRAYSDEIILMIQNFNLVSSVQGFADNKLVG